MSPGIMIPAQKRDAFHNRSSRFLYFYILPLNKIHYKQISVINLICSFDPRRKSPDNAAD